MDDFCAGHDLVIRLSAILGAWRLWVDNASFTRERGRIPGVDLSRCCV